MAIDKKKYIGKEYDINVIKSITSTKLFSDLYVTATPGTLELQEECGTTNISLGNLELLIAKHGLPSDIYVSWDYGGSLYGGSPICVMEWERGIIHTFTGFSWGYSGEGPRGLKDALNKCGISIEQNVINSWEDHISKTWEVLRS